MKILKKVSGYAHYVATVILDDEETNLPNEILISMADGHSKESAIKCFYGRLDGAVRLHPGHFGGIVNKYKENGKNMARIKVYTD